MIDTISKPKQNLNRAITIARISLITFIVIAITLHFLPNPTYVTSFP